LSTAIVRQRPPQAVGISDAHQFAGQVEGGLR
jgi:hypothetical protein